MNTIITSKDAILEASQKLALETGLQSINIRSIATSCSISVGSVYNYFPSKADLIASTVEKIWKTVFHNTIQNQQPDDFIECVIWLYGRIQKGSSEYPTFFTLHSMSFAVEDKAKGRDVMAHYFTHMKANLLHTLCNDKHVQKDAFTDNFTQSDFIDFVFSNIINLSIQKEKNCNMLMEIIKRTIC